MQPHIKRELRIWLSLFSLFLLIGCAHLSRNSFALVFPRVQQTNADNPSAQDLTSQLRTLATSYKSSNTDSAKLQSLQLKAKERKEKLLSLLNSDPQAVRDTFLSEDEIADLPQEIQDDVEKPVSIEGTYTKVILEDFENTSKDESYVVTNDNKRYKLYQNTTIDSGSTVAFSGMELDSNLLVNGQEDSSQVLQSASTLSATGVKKVAVIQYNFLDDTSNPYTQTELQQSIYFNFAGTVNSYYKETSYQLMSIAGSIHSDGDMYGPFTIPFNKSGGCQEFTWKPTIDQMAAAQGFNASLYDNVIYSSPFMGGSICDHAGLAEINGKASFVNGHRNMSVFEHELGHNYGLLHANSLRCTQNGQPVAYSLTCTSTEYGDPVDTMGDASGTSNKQFSNFNKNRLDWLLSNRQTVVGNTGTTTVNIVPLESLNGIAALVIPFTDASNSQPQAYYVEYRQPSAVDNFSPTDPFVKGVTIRRGLYGNQLSVTDLIDANPQTTTFSDAPVAVGQQFYDPVNYIRIKLLSATTTTASIEVSVGITHQQTVSSGSSNSTTVVSPSITGATGNLYLASVSTKPNITVNSVSGLGLTWTRVVGQCGARGQTRVEVWKGTGTPTTGIVTATLSGTALNSVIAVSRYSNATSAVDPFGQNTFGANGACTGGTDTSSYSILVNSSNSALIYAATAIRNRTMTPGTGFTERTEKSQGTGGDIAGIEVQDVGYVDTSTIFVGGTLSGTIDWAVGIVELVP